MVHRASLLVFSKIGKQDKLSLCAAVRIEIMGRLSVPAGRPRFLPSPHYPLSRPGASRGCTSACPVHTHSLLGSDDGKLTVSALWRMLPAHAQAGSLRDRRDRYPRCLRDFRHGAAPLRGRECFFPRWRRQAARSSLSPLPAAKRPLSASGARRPEAGPK